MEKYIYNEQNGLHYELIGNYYHPCLTAPAPIQIGVWGMRRAKYLREHKKVTYTNLLVTDKLNPHLEEVDRQAEEMFFRLVEQFKKAEGITEQLKTNNQIEWVSTEVIVEENEYMHTLINQVDCLYQWVVIDPRIEETFAQAERMLQHKKCVGIKLHPYEHRNLGRSQYLRRSVTERRYFAG